MGLEARCTVRIGRRSHEGKALLETSEILFRGEERLKIPFREIRSVKTRDGRLEVVHAGGTAVFELGDQAEHWAEKIRNPRSRLDKLGVKPGSRVAVVSVADPDFDRELRERGAEVLASGKDLDVAFLGATSVAGLARMKTLRARLKPAGALWVVWPKGRPELKEDHVRAAALKIDLVDVKVAAFSASLSALKLVIPVGKR
jgi:hypothetical protein